MNAKSLARLVLATAMALTPATGIRAANWDPAAADYTGHAGQRIYVSKLGDNSDGSSWQRAYHTIQAGLLAVPNDQGGHQVIVRPDTYPEANLYVAQQGAPGAYNVVVGDYDGKLGSGATGWVVVDSGDPQGQGFKSYDWWSTIRATSKGWSPQHTDPTFSSIDWDRWIIRNLYATGGDAGLFWDLTDKSGAPFTVVVEDCVSIGRAFGGGVGYAVERAGEPTTFRRVYMASLDWWGDAGALAVGAYNTAPPALPDVVCEDCTLVAPDNAVQILFPSKYIRCQLRDCRLIVMNFSQPAGTPSTGIIASNVAAPEQVHVDLEDCRLMGYQVFGTNNPVVNRAAPLAGSTGEIRYRTKGIVQAYVQYQQSLPPGIERLSRWPSDLYAHLAPPHSPDVLKANAVKRK